MSGRIMFLGDLICMGSLPKQREYRVSVSQINTFEFNLRLLNNSVILEMIDHSTISYISNHSFHSMKGLDFVSTHHFVHEHTYTWA